MRTGVDTRDVPFRGKPCPRIPDAVLEGRLERFIEDERFLAYPAKDNRGFGIGPAGPEALRLVDILASETENALAQAGLLSAGWHVLVPDESSLRFLEGHGEGLARCEFRVFGRGIAGRPGRLLYVALAHGWSQAEDDGWVAGQGRSMLRWIEVSLELPPTATG